ncbi:MAG: TetR/AcrR family transcriptional regulator [Pseudomonadota bacterium]
MNTETLTTKGQQTRSRILQAARELFIKQGYDGLIMREVAKGAGMKLGNLQYYFATRDVLLAELIEAEFTADLEAIRAICESDRPPTEQLHRIVSTLVGRWRGESGIVFSALNFLAIHKPAFKTQRREIYDVFYRELREAIKCADPALSEKTCQARAWLLTALVDGAAQQTQTGSVENFLDLIADQALSIALPNLSKT